MATSPGREMFNEAAAASDSRAHAAPTILNKAEQKELECVKLELRKYRDSKRSKTLHVPYCDVDGWPAQLCHE